MGRSGVRSRDWNARALCISEECPLLVFACMDLTVDVLKIERHGIPFTILQKSP